jgi:hypothetical protein
VIVAGPRRAHVHRKLYGEQRTKGVIKRIDIKYSKMIYMLASLVNLVTKSTTQHTIDGEVLEVLENPTIFSSHETTST